MSLTHLSASLDPFSSDAACGLIAADDEVFGMTSEAKYVTCPDCLLRCACGRAWDGHPSPHAITCPMHYVAGDA